MATIPTNIGAPQFSQIALQTAGVMIGTATRTDGQTVINNADAQLSELYMYQNMTLEGGGSLSFTFSSPNYSLAASSALKLVINESASGTVYTKTITIGGTTYLNSNGSFLYVTFSDWASNETLTAATGTAVGALTGANRFIVIFAKRSDNGATPRVMLRNGMTLSVGQTAAFGQVASPLQNITIDNSNTIAVLDGSFTLENTADSTKHAVFDLSNIGAGASRTINIPNANSTTVQANTGAANNFVTAISAQGVVSIAQPTFSNLSGTATNAQLPATISSKTIDNSNTITALDGSLTLQRTGATTKTATFDLSAITAGHNTAMAVPEVNGTDTLQLLSLAQSPTNKTFDATSFFPTISEQMVAGQSFSANTLYAVRLGLGGQSETVERVYAADPSVSGGVNNYFVVGLIYPTGAITAGQTVNVVKMGLLSVGASTYTSGQTGTPIYLTTAGATTLTNPGATDVLSIRVGVVRNTAKIEVQILGWY